MIMSTTERTNDYAHKYNAYNRKNLSFDHLPSRKIESSPYETFF